MSDPCKPEYRHHLVGYFRRGQARVVDSDKRVLGQNLIGSRRDTGGVEGVALQVEHDLLADPFAFRVLVCEAERRSIPQEPLGEVSSELDKRDRSAAGLDDVDVL